LPKSQFVGVDLSRRQIGAGQAAVTQLGLKNIELRAADIQAIDAQWGPFDYILCHGVFSWVPPAVQDKILAICQALLAPHGVALISYNTYPGWHPVRLIRDIVRYHGEQFTEPDEQIEQAGAILNFLATAPDADPLMRQIVDAELKILRMVNSPNYFFHEHLEDFNTPVYFHEFMQRAATCGLQYLAESELRTMLLQHFSPQAQEVLGPLNILQREQYMDFVRNRRFRSTLLCRAGVPLQRSVPVQRMKAFHVGWGCNPPEARIDPRDSRPIDIEGPTGKLNVASPLAKAALAHLAEVHPRQIHFNELLAAAKTCLGIPLHRESPDPRNTEDVLAGAVLAGLSVGLLAISVHPARFTLRPGPRPVAAPLARLQAEYSDRVTNLDHERVSLNEIQRIVIRRLDGRHDRRALATSVHHALRSGEMHVKVDPASRDRLSDHTAGQLVEDTLKYFSSAGLMIE